MAWGDVVTTYTFTGTSDISDQTGTGTATSTIEGAGSYTWSIQNFSITNGESVIQNITPTIINNTLGYSNLGYSGYKADFMLESNFGITGAFVSATINYTTSDMNSGEVQVYNANGNYPLTSGTGNGDKTIMDLTKSTVTLSLSNNYDKKYFNNNHISFQFTFKPNSADSYFQINSITITTTPVTFYGITVAGTSVRSDNVSNVLNDDFSSVSYNTTTNTLTLKDVDLTYGDDKNINATSALTINLVGYSKVGEINVNDGNSTVELKFTTNETLPGRLKFTNISGNTSIVCENGLSWDNTNKYIKSSSTNPHIIYAFGSNNNGDIQGYNNEGDMEDLDVSPDVAFVYSTNNTDIMYFKVSSSSQSCFLYPASLNDMNLVTKAYLMFDWGTCTNKDVKVQVKGLKSDFTNDGTYSSEVSLPSDGGLVEIPLNGTIDSYYFQLYFSSPTSEFSFIPISVGFLKNTTPTDYGLTIAGTAVTSANASNVFNDATNPRVVFTPATESNPTNTLTLNAYQNNSNSKIASSLPNLTIVINGENSIGDNGGRDGFIESTNANATLTFKKGSANSTLELHSNNDDAVVQGFASVSYDETYYRYSSAVKYDTSEKKYTGRYGLQNLLTITTTPQYLIWIEGEQVSDETKNNLAGGKATFTPGTNTTPNTLLLNGASISSMTAIESDLDNLTISLIGNNTVSAAYYAGYNSIYSFNPNATLTIKKAGDAECELDFITYGEDPVIKGFASVSYDGLNFASKTGTTLDGADTKDAILTSATIYPLWVGGTLVTAANSSGTGWSFDGNTNTLTLDNYTSTYDGHAFAINMPNLNVYLKGTNTVGYENIMGYKAFYSYYTDATLTFSTDENNMGKLDASYYATFCDGFKVDNNIHCIYCLNGLGYYPSTCKIEAKHTPTMHFAKWNETAQEYTGGNVGASETLETTYGVAFKAPRPEFDNGYALGGDSTRYTYSYNPTGIVEIPITNTDLSGNNTFGDIIINKAGTVTITCTFPGNLQNEACSASYTLKVNKADPTISFKKEGNDITSDNTTYGSNYVFPTLDYPNDITEITYSSSNEAVAKYTNNVWSIVGAGETTITATSTANDCYNSASATLTLTVGKGTPTLTFSAATTDATYGEAFTPPTLTKPDDVNVTYHSDNDAVATVNASTGEVTILYPGDAEITASFAGDNNYNAATDASYSIAVHPSAPTLSIESGAYYVGQEITATETVPGDIGSGLYIYQGETFINQVTTPPYTYPFNNVGVFSVKAKTIYVRSGGTNLSPINSEETKATIVINNQPTFTASVGVNAYNETNPQSGNVAVQLAVTDLQANCTLRYYVGNDASKAVNYDPQTPIILSETNTINAYIRYTDNTVTPNIVYDSAPVSKTYTVKQEVVDPFGNDLSYRTCYLSDYSLNKPDGIKVYIITGVSGNSVTTTAIDYIPQGVAVLLEKDGNAPAGGYVAETYTGAAGNFSGNMLKYANAEVTVTDDLYILYNNEFVKATGVIPIENCYLDLSSVNPSRGMYDIGNGTTAIKGITLSEGKEAWYDLQGRRIERPTKPGLYIRNGKKVVVNNK
jgi:hypothetical protein